LLYLERAQFIDLIARNPTLALAVVAKVIGHLRAADVARTTGLMAGDDVNNVSVQPVLALAPDLRTPPSGQPLQTQPLLSTAGVVLAAALVLAAVVGALNHLAPQWLFLILLGAAAALWTANIVMSAAVGLGLVVAWTLFGIATPQAASVGFASPSWLL